MNKTERETEQIVKNAENKAIECLGETSPHFSIGYLARDIVYKNREIEELRKEIEALKK